VLSTALGSRTAELQGVILAGLTAIWIARQLDLGDPVESAKLREQLLALQVSTTRELIERAS